MIRLFKHRGLKRLYEQGITRGISSQHVDRIRRILFHLDTASEIKDINAPGYGLHQLKGKHRGQWAVSVSGNWRVTFRFEDGDIFDVDYVDYH